jgi:hypothetical protein
MPYSPLFALFSPCFFVFGPTTPTACSALVLLTNIILNIKLVNTSDKNCRNGVFGQKSPAIAILSFDSESRRRARAFSGIA